VARITAIMEKARADSAYGKYWPLPERRLNQIKWDKLIFDQLANGIR
jgi:hypothetical protein